MGSDITWAYEITVVFPLKYLCHVRSEGSECYLKFVSVSHVYLLILANLSSHSIFRILWDVGFKEKRSTFFISQKLFQ